MRDRVRTLNNSIWVFGLPDRVRDGLHALLRCRFPNLTICAAGSAGEAQAIITGPSPVLAIIDIELSGDEGMQIVNAIKQKSPHTYCIVLVISENQKAGALRAGADRVLVRGFDARELFAAAELAMEFTSA